METPTKELIRKFNIIANRLETFAPRVPLRVQVRTNEEMKEVLNELKARGLYHAGCRSFVTIPEE